MITGTSGGAATVASATSAAATSAAATSASATSATASTSTTGTPVSVTTAAAPPAGDAISFVRKPTQIPTLSGSTFDITIGYSTEGIYFSHAENNFFKVNVKLSLTFWILYYLLRIGMEKAWSAMSMEKGKLPFQ